MRPLLYLMRLPCRCNHVMRPSEVLPGSARDVPCATIDCYDLICTFDAVHDQADPGRVLGNIAVALRPDGVYLMQDNRASSDLSQNLEHPVRPLLYTISTMRCMSVSLAQDGAGLGTMWGAELALAIWRSVTQPLALLCRALEDPLPQSKPVRDRAQIGVAQALRRLTAL